MKEEVLSKYLEAGRIAAKVLKYIEDYIGPKKKIDLYKLALKCEELIIKYGGKIAFPANIGFNDIAAHYTPLNEEEVLFREGILKIDIGVHIDGYIADTAISIARGYDNQSMARATKMALEAVLGEIRPGVSLGELGGIIEDYINSNGYKVIRDLSGHLIDRYNLHAGKNFPNHREWLSDKIRSDEVYAIEPFATFSNGSGKISHLSNITIFSLAKTKKVKDKSLDKLRKTIMSRYGPLPFTPRWLNDNVSLEDFTKLMRMGILKGYPVLIEKSGYPVSQFEHTVVITDSEVIITTRQ